MKKIDLKGRTAVIFGSGRGIGKETALLLATHGASVVVSARSQNEINQTVSEISDKGGNAIAVRADITRTGDVKKVYKETLNSFGFADIVINSAGVIEPVNDTWKIDPDHWSKNINVNLVGAFNIARYFVPDMTEHQKGTVIFISSGAATHPIPGWNAYCAAKAGLDMFSQTLAREIDNKNIPIRVYSVYPGVVATRMQEVIRSKDKHQFSQVDRFKKYFEHDMLRSPTESAQLLLWLVSTRPENVHGAMVNIDDSAVREQMAQEMDAEKLPDRRK